MTPAKKTEPKIKKAALATDKPGKESAKKSAGKPSPTEKKTQHHGAGPETRKKETAELPQAPKGKKKGKHGLPAPVAPELRQRMVRETAYFMAERRGFSGGSAHDDWVAAEAEIDRMLSGNAAE
jgi:hypothetical protein